MREFAFFERREFMGLLLGLTACGGSAGGGATSGTGSTTSTTGGGAASTAGGATSSAAGGSGGTGASGGSDIDAGPWDSATQNIPTSPFIVVDQFGYRTGAEKLAIARSPVQGFDATTSFTPGASVDVVDVTTGTSVWTGVPVAWNGGATDSSSATGSGDKTWWITFSSLKTPGTYVIVDTTNNVRSYGFRVADDVYADALKAALKMLYYQRSGIAKDAKYAGVGWADGTSFPGDKTCPSYTTQSNPQDVSGGWFDAGDYNKYTSSAAGYVILMLRAYVENPAAFDDAVNIPESNNGVPDILDEAMWEIDFLKRMQDAAGTDGGVLCVVGETGQTGSNTSPPSGYACDCAYGDATTNATINTAAAFAYASNVLGTIPSLKTYASDLLTRAQKAWTWAEANPAVFFYNSGKLAAGEQEGGPKAVAGNLLSAAALLFAATGNATYQSYFDANYNANSLTTNLASYVGPWTTPEYDALLSYAGATGATPAVATAIKNAVLSGVKSGNNLPRYKNSSDAYGAYLEAYTWGSNQNKAAQGSVFTYIPVYGLDATENADALAAAERYVHYFHGLNPLSKVYLSNVNDIGASNSVNLLYHSWFAPGTVWATVGVATYGPAPGYLVGGPNPDYALDPCCPADCGSDANNALCVLPSPPANQPPMKSYKDFSDRWPVQLVASDRAGRRLSAAVHPLAVKIRG